MRYGFGVDIGGTTVKLALFDETGTQITKWEIPTVLRDGGREILPDIAASVAGCMARRGLRPEDTVGIGVGVPGPVDGRGMVNRCVNLGWGVLPIEQTLSDLTGLPVKAGNDANVAALGEYWMGGGRGCGNMIFVTLGTGVGGGILVDGRLLPGYHGAGGEIGHLVLNRQETRLCGCGKRGCAEQYCSATGAVRLAQDYLSAFDGPSVLREMHPLTCKALFDAGREGDGAAMAVLERYYAYLGEFLADLCCVVDPQAVVIGGGVSKAGEALLQGVRPWFDRWVFHAARDVTFALAKLGNDAGTYGAMKLALDACHEKETGGKKNV